MGVIQTWNDILESIGEAAGAFYTKTRWFKELNEPLVGLTCSLWEKYPKEIPFLPYTRGFINSVCAQSGNPIALPAPPPFTGGQCPGVLYDVLVVINRTFAGNTTQVPYELNGYGAIESIALEFQPPESPQQLAVVVRGQPGVGIPTGVDLDNVGGVGFSGSIVSITVTRQDGLPDTCGNPSGDSFPPDPPRDPNDFTKNVTVNYYDENGTVIGDKIVQINIDPQSDLNIPLDIDVDGVQICLDFDGLRRPDPVEVPTEGFKCKRPALPGSDELEETVSEEENAEEKEFEDDLIWVTLDIKGKPDNAKTQWGNGAPDVYYCGWFEFKVNGVNLPRQPIHWINNIYLAPDRATGYAYTLYEGFTGVAKAYTEKVEVVPDPMANP